ncbi:hypothetical protein ACJX0J_028362, partial [Zea mays]
QTLVENLYRARKGHIKFGAIIACTALQKCFIKLEILIFRVHIFTCTCLDMKCSGYFWLSTGSFLHTHYCLYVHSYIHTIAYILAICEPSGFFL